MGICEITRVSLPILNVLRKNELFKVDTVSEGKFSIEIIPLETVPEHIKPTYFASRYLLGSGELLAWGELRSTFAINVHFRVILDRCYRFDRER